MGEPSRDSLVTFARAKVTWGSPPAEVERELLKKGATPEQARQIVRELVAERESSFRERGVRDIAIGSGLILVGVIGLIAIWAQPRPIIQLVVILLGAAAAGIFIVVRGVRRIQTGGSDEGHDSGVSE